MWQFAIILNSANIFCDSIMNIQNKILDIIMDNTRNLQLNYMSIQYPLIGATRLIHHFNPDLYLDVSGKVCKVCYKLLKKITFAFLFQIKGKMMFLVLLSYAAVLHFSKTIYCFVSCQSKSGILNETYDFIERYVN